MRALVAALALGCSAADKPAETGAVDSAPTDTSATPPPTDTEASWSDGLCAAGAQAGGFTVGRWDGYPAIEGVLREAPLPVDALETLETVGACTLYARPNPFCDPACGAGEVCTLEGTCAPYPRALDLGDVDVTGLAEPVTLTADSTGSYWSTSLPDPLFDDGDAVGLTSTGGELEPLALGATGVAPLEGTDALWTVRPGEDLVARWTAAGSGELALTLDVDQHGVSPALLLCTGDDTGELTVPAAVIDAFLARGVSGFPAATLRRRTGGHAQSAVGCVDLEVYQHVNVPVEVDGHTACYDDTWCPDGMTCDLETQTCVP